MADLLAYSLYDYLYKTLTNNLLWEYQDQIEIWKLYIDNIADMAEKVSKSEVDTLKNAGAEIQAAHDAAFAQSMFVFNLVAIPAVAWLGAAIKLKWAPKLTTTSRHVVDRKLVLLNNRYLSGVPSIPRTVTTQNPIANQVIGDVGKYYAGALVNLTAQKSLITSPKDFESPDTKFVQNSNDWQSFRTGLKTTLYKQQLFGKAQIQSISNDLKNHAFEVGQEMEGRLYKEQPHLKHLSGPNADPQRYKAGMDMINKVLNAERAKWAAGWFYYGNDPPNVKAILQILMERELWALWVVENVSEDPNPFDNDQYVTTKAVLSRLRDLAVPVSPSTWQALSAIDRSQALQKIDSKLYEATQEMEDGKDRLVGQWEDDPQMDLLLTGLGDLLGWAKTHVPELGPLDYGVPRTKLPLIETYTSSKFASNYQHP